MNDDTLTCELCHQRSPDVKPGMGWYREEQNPVQAIDRCADGEACRRRIEAGGERWPLRERGEVPA